MLRVLLTLLGIAVAQTLATQQAPECTTYKMLESFLLDNDENVVNISRGFFPPYLTSTNMSNRAYGKSPVFASIIYKFEAQSDNNLDSGMLFNNDTQYTNEEVWFWGESEFHLLLPISIFQFTSLFFWKNWIPYHSDSFDPTRHLQVCIQ